MECRYEDGQLRIEMAEEPVVPMAVLGARSCDLHALAVQDRIFLGDRYRESGLPGAAAGPVRRGGQLRPGGADVLLHVDGIPGRRCRRASTSA